MIQSLAQLSSQVSKINETLDGIVYIQKIYSTSFYICIALRAQGKTWYLYFGRGHGKEGVWIGEKKPESFLRKRDRFLEYLRKHVGGSQLKRITCDSKDRIFCIEFFKWAHINKFYVFYNARNLYFSHHYFDPNSGMMRRFDSWTMKTVSIENSNFDLFDDVGRTIQGEKLGSFEVKKIDLLLNEEKKQALAGSVKEKSMKFYKRKKGRILEDLKNVSEISNLKKLAENQEELEALPHKNKLNGVKLKFQHDDFYKRRDEVYNKIKKLKKAKTILELRLRDTEKSMSSSKQEVIKNQLKTTGIVWRNEKKEIKEKTVDSKQYKIIDLGPISLGVGLSAVGNDQLRSEWAKKSDYWFHLEGDKSPHIIIKLREQLLGETILKVAASALIEFGKFDYSMAQMIYTQVKNLKGVKGATGKVNYKKEKHIHIEVDPSWRNIFS